MNAEIITVGTELLLGDILNENSRFLSQELAVYGIQLHYQSTVGDNVARLGSWLSLAMGRSDLIVLTGRPGPHAGRCDQGDGRGCAQPAAGAS